MISDKLKKLIEAVITKSAVREGKRTMVQQSSKPGYKIISGREVKMSLQEKLKRRNSSRRSQARRSDDERSREQEKREKSMEVREEIEK